MGRTFYSLGNAFMCVGLWLVLEGTVLAKPTIIGKIGEKSPNNSVGQNDGLNDSEVLRSKVIDEFVLSSLPSGVSNREVLNFRRDNETESPTKLQNIFTRTHSKSEQTNIPGFSDIFLNQVSLETSVAIQPRNQLKNARLEIEVGHHLGSITAFSINHDRTLILTGGTDGTARLWNYDGADINGLRLLSTLRAPRGARAANATAYSPPSLGVALSSDGTQAALVFSQDVYGDTVYVYDTQTEEILWSTNGERSAIPSSLWSRVSGHNVNSMAFRPLSSELYVQYADRVIVYRASDGALLHSIRYGPPDDEESGLYYPYSPIASDITVSPNGNFAIQAFADGVRLYSSDGRLLAHRNVGPFFNNAGGGKTGIAYELAFSPSGDKIAIIGRSQDYGHHLLPADGRVLDGRDLRLLYTYDVGKLENGIQFHTPKWSSDGKELIVANRVLLGGGLDESKPIIRRIGAKGRRKGDLTLEKDTIGFIDLQVMADGQIGYVRQNSHEIYTVNGRGKIKTLMHSNLRDVSGEDSKAFSKKRELAVSQSGEDVLINLNNVEEAMLGDENLIRFSISNRTVIDSSFSSTDLYGPKLKSSEILFEQLRYEGTLVDGLVIGGRQVLFSGARRNPNYALLNDSEQIIFTIGPMIIRCPIADMFEYKPWIDSRTGEQKDEAWTVGLYFAVACTVSDEAWNTPLSADITRITVSKDERFAIAETSDTKIHWLDLNTGETLLSLFTMRDGPDVKWIMWTPDGFYDASPGAENLIGWRIDQNDDAAPLFYSVSQFRERFYRPDLISQIITEANSSTLVENQDSAHGPTVLDRPLPPIVRMITKDGTAFSKDSIAIEYKLFSPTNEPISTVRYYVNGRQWRIRTEDNLMDIPTSETIIGLPKRDVTLGIVAESASGSSEQTSIFLRYAGKPEPTLVDQTDPSLFPKLYLFAVGVSDYSIDGIQDLQFAHQDAIDFVETIRSQKGKLYRDIEVNLLTDQQVTTTSVLDGLDWLEKNTTSRDTAIVFIAGHGVSDNLRRYYFLPSNGDPDRLKSTAVDYFAMRETIRAISGRAIMFIDTCHSGGAFGEQFRASRIGNITPLINELASDAVGAVVFSSSTGEQLSIEMDELQNGAFTEAVISGLNGAANYTDDDLITIKELDLWIVEEVKRLTRGRQHPVTEFPKETPDSALARVQ